MTSRSLHSESEDLVVESYDSTTKSYEVCMECKYELKQKNASIYLYNNIVELDANWAMASGQMAVLSAAEHGWIVSPSPTPVEY